MTRKQMEEFFDYLLYREYGIFLNQKVPEGEIWYISLYIKKEPLSFIKTKEKGEIK